MTRFSKLAAAFAVLPVLALSGSTALANSAGQIEGGDIYRVKNVTHNTAFADPISADKCEVVQFKVRIHNPGPDTLTGVTVKATLPSTASTTQSSQVTVSATNANPATTTDTAAVNLPAAYGISYEAGSTQLLDPNNAVLQNLPDGITTGAGVNIGSVGVSLGQIRFVQFKADISCPTPTPPVVSFACTELDVTNIDRTHFDFTAKASASNATVTSYGFTAKDANGNTVDTNTVTTGALSAVYHFSQANVGTYSVSAVVNTDHGSTSASACTKQVVVAAVPTTPATPAATALPNTGAGDVLGIFGGASAFGTAGHYLVSRRRRGL